jgi:hypothetical protein
MTPATMFSAAVSATVILSGLLLFNRHTPKERAISVEVVRIDDMPPLPPEPPEVKKTGDPARVRGPRRAGGEQMEVQAGLEGRTGG